MRLEKNLVLIRGLPGSGKSSLAKLYVEWNYAHFEADQYFTDPYTGEYKFEGFRVPLAHEYCYSACEASMVHGRNVVISNTFTTRREMEPYYRLAEEHGYTVQVVLCQGNFRSVHNVPDASMKRMRERFEYVQEAQ